MSAYMRGFWDGVIGFFITIIFIGISLYGIYLVLTAKGLGI